MVKAEWTGRYPNLCDGEWVLFVNGKFVSDKIPNELRSTRLNYECEDAPLINGMNTYGEYSESGKCEEDESFYKDGLKCDEWIEENAYWLDTITTDYNIQEEIYNAINENDWRRHSCGGCI